MPLAVPSSMARLLAPGPLVAQVRGPSKPPVLPNSMARVLALGAPGLPVVKVLWLLGLLELGRRAGQVQGTEQLGVEPPKAWQPAHQTWLHQPTPQLELMC